MKASDDELIVLSDNLQEYISAILGMKQPYRLLVGDDASSPGQLLLQRLFEADSLWNLGESKESQEIVDSVQTHQLLKASSSSADKDKSTMMIDSFANGLESLNAGDLTKALTNFRQAANTATATATAASNNLLKAFFTERAVNIAFWMACSGKMLEAALVLENEIESTPFAGGILSFAHYMKGDSVLAETIAQKAIAKGMDDPWTIHAVAHALTSQNRHEECADWLLLHRSKVTDCNPFMKGHMEFHLALSYIYLKDKTKLNELIQGNLWGTMSESMKSDYWNAAGLLNVLWKAELRGMISNLFDEEEYYSTYITQALEKIETTFQGEANASKSSVFSLCIFRFATAGSMREKWKTALLGDGDSKNKDNHALSNIAKAVSILYHGNDDSQQQAIDPLLIGGTKPVVEPVAGRLSELGASPEQRETIDDFVRMIQDALQ